MRIAAVETAGDADRTLIARHIQRFNVAAMPRMQDNTSFAFHLHDEADEVVGGAMARKVLDWVYLDLLFVPEGQRGTGLGRQLLERVEDRALALGAHGVWLLTFGFQAQTFYEHCGYELIGTLPGATPDADELILRKPIKSF